MAASTELIDIKIKATGLGKLDKLAQGLEKASVAAHSAFSAFEKTSGAADTLAASMSTLKSSLPGINTELNKISKATQGVERSVKSTATAMSNSVGRIKAAQSALEKYGSAATSVAGQNKALNATKATLASTTNASTSANKTNTKSHADLSVAQLGQTQSVLGLGKAMDKYSGVLKVAGSGLSSFGSGISSLTSGFAKFGSEISKPVVSGIEAIGHGLSTVPVMVAGAAGSLASLGTKIAGLGAAAAGLGTAKVMSSFADFQYNLNAIYAISEPGQRSFESLDKLKASALKLGADFPVTATEVAQGYLEMAKAGFTMNEIVDSGTGLVYLATAGNLNMAKSSEILAGYLKGFNLQATQATRVSDVLSVIVNKSAVDFKDLGESMKYVVPVAGAMEYSIEDVNAALGILGNRTIKGSTAGTTLRAIFDRLIDPPKAAAASLRELNFSAKTADGNLKPLRQTLEDLRKEYSQLDPADKAKKAFDIAGRTAAPGFLALMTASQKEFDDMFDSVLPEKAKGASKRMSDELMHGVKGALLQLTGSVDTLKLTFGDAASGPVTNFLNLLTDISNSGNKAAYSLGDKFGKGMQFVTDVLGKTRTYMHDSKTNIDGLSHSSSLADGTIKGFGRTILESSGLFDKFGNRIGGIIKPTTDLSTAIAAKLSNALQTAGNNLLGFWKVFSPFSIMGETLVSYFDKGLGAAENTLSTRFKAIGKVVLTVIPELVNSLERYSLTTLDWIGSHAGQILTKFTSWSFAFVEWIGPIAGRVGLKLAAVIGVVLNWIENNYQVILTRLGKWGVAFVEWTAGVSGLLIGKLYWIVSDMLTWIGSQAPTILDKMLVWGESFIGWTGKIAGRLLASLAYLLTSVLNWVGDNAAIIGSKFLEWTTLAVQWVAPLAANVILALGRALGQMVAWVTGHAPEIAQAFESWLFAIADAFGKGDQFRGFIEGVGNVVEFILGKFLPAIGHIVTVIAPAIPTILALGATFLGMRLAVGVLSDVAIGVFKLYSSIETIIAVISSFGVLISSAGGALALLTGPIGLAVIGVGALGIAFATNFGGIRDLVLSLIPAFTFVLDTIASFAGLASGFIGDFVKSLDSGIRGIVTLIQALIEAVYRLAGALGNLAKLDFGAAWESLQGKNIPDLAKLRKATDDLAGSAKNLNDSGKSDDYSRMLNAIGGSAAEFSPKIATLTDASSKLPSPLNNAAKAADNFGRATSGASGPAKTLADEIDRLSKQSSEAGRASSEAQSMLGLLDNKISKMPQPVQDLWKSYLSLNKAYREGGIDAEKNASAITIVGDKLRAYGGEAANVVDAAEYWNDILKKNNQTQEDNAISIAKNNQAKEKQSKLDVEISKKTSNTNSNLRKEAQLIDQLERSYNNLGTSATVFSEKSVNAFKSFSPDAVNALKNLGPGVVNNLKLGAPLDLRQIQAMPEAVRKTFSDLDPVIQSEIIGTTDRAKKRFDSLNYTAFQELSKLPPIVKQELAQMGPITDETIGQLTPLAKKYYDGLKAETKFALSELTPSAQEKLKDLEQVTVAQLRNIPLALKDELLSLGPLTLDSFRSMTPAAREGISSLTDYAQLDLLKSGTVIKGRVSELSTNAASEFSKLPPLVRTELSLLGPISRDELSKLTPEAALAYQNLSDETKNSLGRIPQYTQDILSKLDPIAQGELSKLGSSSQVHLSNLNGATKDILSRLPDIYRGEFAKLSPATQIELLAWRDSTRSEIAKLPADAVTELSKLNAASLGEISRFKDFTVEQIAALPPAAKVQFDKLPPAAKAAFSQLTPQARADMLEVLGVIQSQGDLISSTSKEKSTAAKDSWLAGLDGIDTMSDAKYAKVVESAQTNIDSAASAVSKKADEINKAWEKGLSKLPLTTDENLSKVNSSVTKGVGETVATFSTTTSTLPILYSLSLSQLEPITTSSLARVDAAIQSANLFGSAYLQGLNVGYGLAIGIAMSAPSAIAAAQNLADSVRSIIAFALAIHSPSEATKYLGRMSGEGFAEGIEESTELAVNAAEKMASSVKDTIGSNTGTFTSGLSKDAIDAAVKNAEDLSKAAEANTKIADALVKIKSVGRIGNDTLTNFVQTSSMLITLFASTAGAIKAEGLKGIADYSDLVGKIADSAGKMADSLIKVASMGKISLNRIIEFTDDTSEMVARFYNDSKKFSAEMLVAAQFYADVSGKVADAAGKMADTLTKVAKLGSIGKEAIWFFTQDVFSMVADFFNGSHFFTDEMLAAASAFAETAGKVAESAGKMADSLAKIRNWAAVGRESIWWFTQDVFSLVADFFNGSHFFTPEMLKAASEYADTGAKAADTTLKMVDALNKIRDWGRIGSDIIWHFTQDVFSLVAEFFNGSHFFTVHMLEAASNYADTAGKVGDSVGKIVPALNLIRTYIKLADGTIDKFGSDLKILVKKFSDDGLTFSTEMLTAASSYAEAGAKVSETIGKGVEGLLKLNFYSGTYQGGITKFIDDLKFTVKYLIDNITDIKEGSLTAAKNFAESGGSVADLIGKGVTGFLALSGYGGASITAVKKFIGDIVYTLNLLEILTKDIAPALLDKAKSFGDSTGSLFDGLSKAIGVFKDIKDLKDVAPSAIDALVGSINYTIEQVTKLKAAVDNILQAQITAFGESTNKLFDGLSSALGVFKDLIEIKDVPGKAIDGLIVSVEYAINKVASMATEANTKLIDQANLFLTAVVTFFNLVKEAMEILKGIEEIKDIPAQVTEKIKVVMELAVIFMKDIVQYSDDYAKQSDEYKDNLKHAAESMTEGLKYLNEARRATPEPDSFNASKPETQTMQGNVLRNLSFGGMAGGGATSQGVPIVVGELGREVFIPNTDGYIVNNSLARTSGMLPSTSGASTASSSAGNITSLSGFIQNIKNMFDAFKTLNTSFKVEDLEKVSKFADTAAKIVSVLSNAFDFISKIPKTGRLIPSILAGLVSDISYTNTVFSSIVKNLDPKTVENSGVVADSIGKIVGGLKNSLEFLVEIKDYHSVAPDVMGVLLSDINIVASRMIQAAANVDQILLPATSELGKALGDVFSGLKNGVEALNTFRRYVTGGTQNLPLIVEDMMDTLYLLTYYMSEIPQSQIDLLVPYYKGVGEIMVSLKDSLSALRYVSTLASYAPGEIDNQIKNLADAVGRMGELVSESAAFKKQAQDYSSNMYDSAMMIKNSTIAVNSALAAIVSNSSVQANTAGSYSSSQQSQYSNDSSTASSASTQPRYAQSGQLSETSNQASTAEGNIIIHQPVTIIVPGGQNPEQTARDIKKELERLNSRARTIQSMRGQ